VTNILRTICVVGGIYPRREASARDTGEGVMNGLRYTYTVLIVGLQRLSACHRTALAEALEGSAG